MERWPWRRRGSCFYSDVPRFVQRLRSAIFATRREIVQLWGRSFSPTPRFLRGKTQTSPRIQRCHSTRSAESDGPVKSSDACRLNTQVFFRHMTSAYKDRQSSSTCLEDYKILGMLQVEQRMKSLSDNLLPGDKSQPLKNLKLSGGYYWGYAEHVPSRK